MIYTLCSHVADGITKVGQKLNSARQDFERCLLICENQNRFFFSTRRSTPARFRVQSETRSFNF